MGSAIRGSRVGAGPMGEAERGEAIPRFRVSYWCANGHETKPSFAQDGTVVFLRNGIALVVATQLASTKISHLCQLRMSLTKLTWLTSKSVAPKQKLKRFWKMHFRRYVEMTN